jgi:hypothetical protein
MNAVAAILALAALLAGVVLLVVASAMLRAVDRLRTEVADLRAESHARTDPVADAIPVGSMAPSFTARSADGSAFSSADLAGTLRVVAFARPGCPPCEELVPALLRGAAHGDLPPAVVVSRGAPSDQPEAWRVPDPRARLVMEDDDRVSRLFRSIVAPQVFVLTPAGRVGARGIATTPDDVRALVRSASPAAALGGRT